MQVPKDWMLALAALVMFSVVPCIMIVVLILDDYKGTEVEDQETNSARDVRTLLYTRTFTSVRFGPSQLSASVAQLVERSRGAECQVKNSTSEKLHFFTSAL